MLPSHDGHNLEQGRGQPPDIRPAPSSAGLGVGDGEGGSPSDQHNASLHRNTSVEADGFGGRGIFPPPAPLSFDGQVQWSDGHAKNAATAAAAEDRGAGLAGEGATGDSAEKLSAATPTAYVSTSKRDELAQLYQRECVAGAAPAAGGPKPDEASGGGPGSSPAANRRKSAGDIRMGHAVLAAALELVHHCQIPGVSEAATAVCIMANLVTDNRENAGASESRLRQCSTIVMALKRAAKVAEKVS